MANYDSNYAIAQEISARIGVSPIPFDSVYSIALEIYNELGGEPTQFDSVYSILLSILPLIESAGDSRLSELLATDECIIATTISGTTGVKIRLRSESDSNCDISAVVWGDGTYTETDGTTITNGDNENTIIEMDEDGYFFVHTYEIPKTYAINVIGTHFWGTFMSSEYNVIKSLYINKGVDVLNAYVISYQTHIEHITFNDECHTSLGNYCFCYGGELNNIYIPDGVVIAGEGQFWNINVANFVFGRSNNLTTIPAYFNYCTIDWHDWSYMPKLEIPEGVTSIGDSAFGAGSPYIGSTLRDLSLPSTLTTIGINAFTCIMANDVVIDIPASVTSMDDYAFYRAIYQGSGSTQDGTNRYTIICRATTLPSLGRRVFYGNGLPPTYCTLYVPNDVIDLYRNAPQWSEFGTILPIESMGLDIATNAEIEQMF